MAGFGLSFMTYLIAAVTTAIVVGMVWYGLEKNVLCHLYRWYYDVTRAEPMPANEERGILLGWSTTRQRWIVTVFSIIQSAIVIWTGHASIFAEIVAMVVEIPAFLIGFWLGEWLHGKFSWGSILDRFDRMGDARKSMEPQNVATKAKSRLGEILGRFALKFPLILRKSTKGPVTKPEEKTQEAKAETVQDPPKPKEDPHDVIARYTRGRTS